MKLRYLILAAMAAVAVEASAWTTEVNKAILMLAEENLSRKAQKEVEAVLGAPLSSIEFAQEGKSKTRLNESGKSVTTDAKDGVVVLEKALATLRTKGASIEERKAALLAVAEHTVDIHCPANILIDKHLEGDFKFGRENGRPRTSRWFKVDKREWQSMWHKLFHTQLGAWSADMYIYDWHIATKGMAKQFKKQEVAPRLWAEQTGGVVLEALKVFKPNAEVGRMQITNLEEVNNNLMYKAAFRLADVLNQTLK